MNTPDFLSTKQLADLLMNDEGTLANWRIAGTGPKFVKIGSKVRYRMSDVEAWIDSRTVENTTEAAALR